MYRQKVRRCHSLCRRRQLLFNLFAIVAVALIGGSAPDSAAAGWYEENVPQGIDLYTVEFKWKQWPPGTYIAFWNGKLYPKGGTYYGGLPSGPRKGEVDYHPGLIWSFWNHKDYNGKIARAIYTDPDMYAHQYGGEGMCGGIAGDRLPWLRADAWYRMMIRVWRPEDPAADYSYFGWWCKDLSNNHWRLLGVFQIPCVATGLEGNCGFFELLSEKQERRFLARRNGYHRLNGNWGPSQSMTVHADEIHTWLAELSDDGRVAEFMHSKNPADEHNLAPGEQKTITVTQPPEPVLDPLSCTITEGFAADRQVALRWEVPSLSAPALRFHITAYAAPDCQGDGVAEFRSSEPFLRSKSLQSKEPARSARLTDIDVFDRKIETTVNLTPMELRPPAQPGPVFGGLQYAYYPSATDLSEIPDLNGREPTKSGIVNSLDIHLDKDRNFAVSYRGYLKVPTSGLYGFTLQSCDGSMLVIDGEALIDNNGLHSTAAQSRNLGLEKGYHRFELRYFKGPRERYREIALFWEGPDFPRRAVADKDLFHDDSTAPSLEVAWRRDGDQSVFSPTFNHSRNEIKEITYYCNQQMLGSSKSSNIDDRFNAARGGELSSSGRGEPGHSDLRAVADGNLDTFYYAAAGPDAWVAVDLKRLITIETIFTKWYVDGTRYYTYTIEASTDGITWTAIARRDATVAETTEGNLHRITPAAARYIRLSNIRNSANGSLHLAEIMIFPSDTPHAPPSFTLSTLLPDGPNQIWARATDASGNTTDSAVYTIECRASVNSPFTLTTLGETGLPAAVSANGGDAGFIGEGRQFMWQKVSGDFELTTQIGSFTRSTAGNAINSNSWIGLAVMDVVDERWPLLGLYQTAGKQLRASDDFTDFGGTRLSESALPADHSWLRLVRHGHLLQALTSADGASWQLASEKIFRNLNADLYAGALFRTIPYLNRTLFSATIHDLRLAKPAVPPAAAPPLPLAQAGPVLAFVQDPVEPSRLYARCRQGVRVSTDSGRTWTPAFPQFDSYLVRSLAVHPRDNRTLLLATHLAEADGRLRSQLHSSHDQGKNWKRVWETIEPANGPDNTASGELVAFNPVAPDSVYMGTADGLWASSDAGETWKFHSCKGQYFSTIAFSPENKNQLVGCSQSRKDGAATYHVYIADVSQQNPQPVLSLADFHVTHIAFDPREVSMIHLTTDRGLYNTWNGGATFFHRGPLQQDNASVSNIAVDRAARQTLLLVQDNAGSRLLTSDWGVRYRRPEAAAPAAAPSIPSPISHLLAVDGSPGTLLIAAPNGIFRSSDNGLAFTQVEFGK